MLFTTRSYRPSIATMQTSPTTTSTPLVVGRPISTASYCHTGIGGAGNYHKSPPSSIPRASRRSPVPRSFRSLFTTGVGGAGNVHAVNTASSISAEEKYLRAKTRESRFPVRWFVSIGGAGNRKSRERLASSDSSAVSHKESNSFGSAEEKDSDIVAANGDAFVRYSNQALPYGAADVLKARMGEVLGKRR